MGELEPAMSRNPVEIIAGLIVHAELQKIYIEHQDIYPLQSQKAARILPVIEESIEWRLADLSIPQQRVAYDIVNLNYKSKEE